MKREMPKPAVKPANPSFSSGPGPKRPGWSLSALEGALVGRSHRSKEGRARLQAAIDQTRSVLGVPADYRIAIVPASDTGAVEMALWSLLGPRPVDVLAWENFGQEWVADITESLRLPNARVLSAPYGELPDLALVDFSHDVVLVWNGTTSGARVPNGDWIPADRTGLTICDATSAVFAMEIPWDKLDVVTFSWQKVLGGEGAHGMLILGPRAAERLTTHEPAHPLPKIFRLAKDRKIDEALFAAATINTPSMLCVEDYLDALRWSAQLGGLSALCARSQLNLAVLTEWVARTPWVAFLVADEAIRSSTSICLKLTAPWFLALDAKARSQAVDRLVGLLAEEAVAYDIAAYRSAPPGLRIWGGATVDATDLEALLPWLEWAYAQIAPPATPL